MGNVGSSEPLPPALPGRVSKVSAVLVPPSMGFLAVQLIFDGQPASDRRVQFFACVEDGEDGKGDPIGDTIVSDREGVVRLPRLVATGHYVCEIDAEERTIVTTVNQVKETCPVTLPIGAEIPTQERRRRGPRERRSN